MMLSEIEKKGLWLEDRKTLITGTNLACILGLSKFGGSMSVWLEKKGKLEVQDNEAMFSGRLFEKPILEAYSKINEIPVTFADSYKVIRVPDFDLLGATLDARWTFGDKRPVDAKNIRIKSSEFGENGSDIIPIYYQTQLAVQMMACNTEYAELAVCFSGQDHYRYVLERDRSIEDAIKEKVQEWWNRYIIGNEMPEADASDSCTDYIRSRFKKAESGLIKEPTEEILETIKMRKEAAEAEKEAEKIKIELDNKIKCFMGEAESIPGVLTWKNNKDSEKVNWEEVALSFANEPNFNTIKEKYTEIKTGARVLRFK